jgi:hypothetical protein
LIYSSHESILMDNNRTNILIKLLWVEVFNKGIAERIF